MAVPGSGQLKLYSDIWIELAGTQGNNSLRSASVHAGFTVPDAMSEFYGYVDAELPTVVTNAASGITTSNITANGNVTADGGAAVTENGFYFGTNSSNPTSNTKYSVSSGTGAYSRNFSVGSYSTRYMWAYAINTVGEVQGDQVSATSSPDVPALSSARYCVCGTPNNPEYFTTQWYSNQSGAFYEAHAISTTGTVDQTGNYVAHGRANRISGTIYVQGPGYMYLVTNSDMSNQVNHISPRGTFFIQQANTRNMCAIILGGQNSFGYAQFDIA